MFEQQFEPLHKDNQQCGMIAMIPWDTETFGFGVADYKIEDSQLNDCDSTQTREYLKKWADNNKVEIIGTILEAHNADKLRFLQSLGFVYINMNLTVFYGHLRDRDFSSANLSLEPASNPVDIEQAVDISGNSFHIGRYHSDSRFPKELADKRYRDWVLRTLMLQNNQELLIAKKDGRVCAFSVIEIISSIGLLHLNAVAGEFQGQKIGLGLIASTLKHFQTRGANTAQSTISAANVRPLNIHSFLGARFADARLVLHWHNPSATHLKKL